MASKSLLCAAISGRTLLEFDYDGQHRVVAPYCHGLSRRGHDVLRAVQLKRASSTSRSGFGFGKLWQLDKMLNLRLTGESFSPDDPHYNPNDSALKHIHCRI